MDFSLMRALKFLETLIEYKHEDDTATFLKQLKPNHFFERPPFKIVDIHMSTTRCLIERKLDKQTLKADITRRYDWPKHYDSVWKD